HPSVRTKRGVSWAVGGHTFGPTMLIDGNLKTCWQEGNNSTRGDGEYVVVYFKKPTDLTEIKLANGCQDFSSNAGWGDLFSQNPRVKRLQVESNKGDVEMWTLQDATGWQTLDVDMRDVSNLTFTIIGDVYRGTEWKDASISEISFRGYYN
ncbi:MAG: NADase-type glycan-binding domain-containing protein, partial [Myxococcota bacterium]